MVSKLVPEHPSGSSAAATEANRYAASSPAQQEKSLTRSRWVLGAIILTLIVGGLSYVQHTFYLEGYATKAEVARLVARLPENCRVIAGHRISAKISEKGAPLTRADMNAMPQCAATTTVAG